MSIVLFVAVIFLSIFLNGCVSFKRDHTTSYTPWEKRQAALEQIKVWKLAGVVSVTYNQRRDIVRFKWVQEQDSYSIEVSGPLGINSVRIIGDADGIEFWYTHDKCVKSSTPERLMQNVFGWQLPISSMRYWTLSLPVPKTKIIYPRFDQYGRLIYFEQSGWQIKYFDFKFNLDKKLELPHIIELSKGDIIIKMTVKLLPRPT